MVTVNFVEADGTTKVVEVPEGTTVMVAATENGVNGIQGDCGGACSCATCHCYIPEEFATLLQPPSDIEQSMIEFAVDPQPNSRLGCQIELTEAMDGIVIRLPESQF